MPARYIGLCVCCLPALSGRADLQAQYGGPFTLVPIPQVTRTWDKKINGKWVTLERTMLPLILAWALTIHKSQGQTLAKAVLGVGDLERQLGLLFVAISRVKRTEDFALVAPVALDRLRSVNEHQSREPRDRMIAQLASLESPFLDWVAARLGCERDATIGALRAQRTAFLAPLLQ